jgi:hypothetical protein
LLNEHAARIVIGLLMVSIALDHARAQSRTPPGTPSLRYKEASGCAGLFMYAWNDDRSEVLTIKADRNEFKFPDGETTIDIAKAGPGIAVHVEVTPGPRASLPFCSDEGTKSDEQPKVWVAVAGKVKIMLKRRAGAAFQPVNARVDDLVLRSPEGAEVKQRRDIQFTAAVGDFDK